MHTHKLAYGVESQNPYDIMIVCVCAHFNLRNTDKITVTIIILQKNKL